MLPLTVKATALLYGIAVSPENAPDCPACKRLLEYKNKKNSARALFFLTDKPD